MPAVIQSLKFSVREIQASEGLKVSGDLASEAWSLKPQAGATLAQNVRAELEFSVGGNRVLLQGSVSGAWLVSCSRCLAEHLSPFASTLDETYPLTRETIDVTEEIRQAVMLEIPQKPLCSPGCRGLCPQCGKNLNEGPCRCPEQKLPSFSMKKR